jgi:DNA mismatch endonuclease (patch repair protein)
MQAVKGRNTSLEKAVAAAFQRQGWRYRRNYSSLPGKPDFVFARSKIAVFVDGDFWHGWRYPLWKHKLSDYWQKKIEGNRRRDRYNFRLLRRQGWKVLRVWGHEVERDLAEVVERVRALLETSRTQVEISDHAPEGERDLRRRRRNAE